MSAECICIQNDVNDHRLQKLVRRYFVLKNGQELGPYVEQEIILISNQLLEYSDEALKEAGIENPIVLTKIKKQ